MHRMTSITSRVRSYSVHSALCTSFLLTHSCITGKEVSRQKARTFGKNQNQPKIPKPKGQHGRKKGGYNLQDELGLGENKAKYDALKVSVPSCNLSLCT